METFQFPLDVFGPKTGACSTLLFSFFLYHLFNFRGKLLGGEFVAESMTGAARNSA